MAGLEYLEKGPAPVVGQNVRYAGFWIRFAAQFIDGIIYFIVTSIPSFVVGIIAGIYGFDIKTPFLIVLTVVSVVLYWLYPSLFISSKYMATPGKIICGIKVTDMEGNRVSFSRATMRYLFKNGIGDIGNILGYIVPLLNVFFLFTLASPLFIPFNEKKQAIHDMLAGTYVIYK